MYDCIVNASAVGIMQTMPILLGKNTLKNDSVFYRIDAKFAFKQAIQHALAIKSA